MWYFYLPSSFVCTAFVGFALQPGGHNMFSLEKWVSCNFLSALCKVQMLYVNINIERFVIKLPGVLSLFHVLSKVFILSIQHGKDVWNEQGWPGETS